MSEKPDKLKYKYIFPDDYNPPYANGCYGGVTTKGEIVANFFFERMALQKSITYEVIDNATIGEMIDYDPKPLPVIRFITSGVTLSLDAAKTIRDWLDRNIDSCERLLAEAERRKEERNGSERN